jgi:hypothetical protein
MDIKKIMDVSPSVSPLNRRGDEKPAGLTFEELLKQANPNQKSISQTTSPLPSHGEVEAVSSLPFIMSKLGEVTQARLQGIEAAEGALSLLEQYQEAMADPDVSLKKVDPVVQFLSKEVNGLNLLSERLSPSDPLQKILTEVGIVSTVEIEKFRRGEYI